MIHRESKVYRSAVWKKTIVTHRLGRIECYGMIEVFGHVIGAGLVKLERARGVLAICLQRIHVLLDKDHGVGFICFSAVISFHFLIRHRILR